MKKKPLTKATKIKEQPKKKGAAAAVTSTSRQALGRGLSLLLAGNGAGAPVTGNAAPKFQPQENTLIYLNKGEEQITKPQAVAEPVDGELREIPLEQIVPNPYQPRRSFRAEELKELADSIRESGILQAVVVRRVESGFELIAGERRYRAAELVGLKSIPAVIRDLTDRESLGLAIVENIQRSDLNSIEEALSYKRLADEFGETQEGIAKIVGKERVTVANALRLLKLPAKVQELITSGKLSAGHGRALLMVESASAQETLAQRAVAEGLSVRAMERLVGGKEIPSKTTSTPVEAVKSPAIQAVEDRLRRALGTKVTVQSYGPPTGKTTKGEIRIGFYSSEELENILERVEGSGLSA